MNETILLDCDWGSWGWVGNNYGDTFGAEEYGATVDK